MEKHGIFFKKRIDALKGVEKELGEENIRSGILLDKSLPTSRGIGEEEMDQKFGNFGGVILKR